MTSRIAIEKLKLRLEKLDSSDYDNLTTFQIEEAVNKAVLEFIREKKKRSDENTSFDVDDLQILLKEQALSKTNKKKFVLSSKLPADYLFIKRLSPKCNKGLCENIYIKSTLVEDANADELLQDYNSQPSFDFEETFHTMIGNRVKVYHNDDFDIEELKLVYYRKPQYITFDNLTNTLNWEWKDDVAEHIIDKAAVLLSADTGNMQTYNFTAPKVQNNQ